MAAAEDVSRLTRSLIKLFVLRGELKIWRESAQLTHAQIGEAAGASGETVEGWERGYGMPTTAQALAWIEVVMDAQPRSQAMGVSYDDDSRVFHDAGAAAGE